MTELPSPAGLEGYLGRVVVLDVRSPFVILGRMTQCQDTWLELTDADVHDLRDSNTTRELYVLDALRHGIRRNRRRVRVRADEIVSVAALEDITED